MSTGTETVDENRPESELKRVMGPRLLLLFIVGDILGAGVYAVTGEMALEVGGVVWVPFLVAFAVATMTAYSYLELVTKYPQAAGAALYTHKAFGLHFVTFLVAFAVVCSGITSASTSSNLLATNLLAGFDGLGLDVNQGSTAITITAMGFMLVLAAINLRGVGESVKFNVVLTLIEMTALADRDRDRLRGDGPGRRRHGPRGRVSSPAATAACSSPSPWRPRSRSSRWSASRTP